MKKILLFILLVLNDRVPTCFAQTSEVFTFYQICDYSKDNLTNLYETKSHRANSRGFGKISITYDRELPDSLMFAVEEAVDAWQRYLGNNDSLDIEIIYEPLQNSDIRTDVTFHQYSGDNLMYPNILYRKLWGKNTNVNVNHENVIRINSNTNWCIGNSASNDSKKLSIAIFQNIARCLGYGSTLKETNGRVSFLSTRGKSVFDNIIIADDGTRLSDINPRDFKELYAFATGNHGEAYVIDKSSDRNKLYLPEIFDEYASLKYSLDSTSIMCIDSHRVSPMNLAIDSNTQKVLNHIGWLFEYESPIRIKCDSLDETGIASAYLPYTFYLDGVPSISNIKWRMELPDLNGDYITSQVSNSKSFIIAALTNVDSYKHTIDGDILGKIVCTGIMNGKEVEASYAITFELKPRILSVKILDVTPNKNNSTYYDATVEVRYEGSNYISGLLEEEYFSGVSYYNSSASYLTRFNLKTVDSWGDAWFTLTTKNKYGNATYELTLPAPQFGNSQLSEVENKLFVKQRNATILKTKPGIIIPKGETVRFCDNSNKQWSLIFKKKWRNEKDARIELGSGTSLSINSDSLSLKWGDIKVYKAEGKPYIPAYLVVNDCASKDTIKVLFDVFPIKPEILMTKYTYEKFDYDALLCDNDELSVLIMTSDAVPSAGIVFDPHSTANPTIKVEFEPIVENLHESVYNVSYSTFAPHECVIYYVNNSYGLSIPTDSIYISDYITDNCVRGALGLKPTGITSFPQDGDSLYTIYKVQDGIQIKGNVRNVSVYYTDGTKIKQMNNLSNEVKIDLKKGIYIIKVLLNNNKNIIRKIAV